MADQFYVYILANAHHTVLYTGVTNNLGRRVWEHREQLVKGFTKRYNVKKLVYYEGLEDPRAAIAREKQIKAGSRKQKEKLIESLNPQWTDLWESIATTPQ